MPDRVRYEVPASEFAFDQPAELIDAGKHVGTRIRQYVVKVRGHLFQALQEEDEEQPYSAHGDTLAVEREFVETWLDRRELDYLIYNDPGAYAELVLADDVKGYLDTVRQGQ